MGIVKKRTSTAGQKMTDIDRSVLTKKKPEKSLITTKKRTSGRNSQGRITVRHRGGGAKRKLRIVDFNRTTKLDINGTVKAIEYDPGRSAFLALIFYSNGEKSYILASENMKIGDEIICSEKTKIKNGNRLKIGNIPTGFQIYNVEISIGKGGQMIRSAGSSGKVVSQDGDITQVEFPSGEVRKVLKNCFATIGTVSNSDHMNVRIGKAGRKRKMGWRPTVLGKSMNAADHPHGGGEGHSPIGMKSPKTPWGQVALGKKTRKLKKYSNKLIVKRRKKKR